MTETWTKSSQCESNACVEVAFAKSTYSNPSGNCVEVGFHKSSYSGNNGSCVEVGTCDCQNEVLVRDTKDREGPVLSFSTGSWAAFIDGVKAGDFSA